MAPLLWMSPGGVFSWHNLSQLNYNSSSPIHLCNTAAGVAALTFQHKQSNCDPTCGETGSCFTTTRVITGLNHGGLSHCCIISFTTDRKQQVMQHNLYTQHCYRRHRQHLQMSTVLSACVTKHCSCTFEVLFDKFHDPMDFHLWQVPRQVLFKLSGYLGYSLF